MRAGPGKAFAAVLSIAAFALTLAGCGSSSTKTVTETKTVASAAPTTATTTPADTTAADTTATTATTATQATTPADDPSQDCDKAGFDDTAAGKVGTCTNQGVRLSFGNFGDEVRLRTLSATLNACRQASTVSDSFGETAKAKGVFVICSLSIRNLTNKPNSISVLGDQTLLEIHDRTFSEDTDAELSGDGKSFASKADDIQPDEVQTADVVYDVPTADVRDLGTHGGVFLVDFDQDFDTATAAAALRTHS